MCAAVLGYPLTAKFDLQSLNFLPYLAVPILVHCEYHLTDLLCRDVEAPKDKLQLLRRHAALGVLVEHAKRFLKV